MSPAAAGRRAAGAHVSPVARRSPAAVGFMQAWFERFMRRHLNALRVAAWGMPEDRPGVPLVVYSNHPAWWDAALLVVLAGRLLPGREGYGPIDAPMLRKYGFFARLGMFGVEPGTARGAAAFLRAAREVLAEPRRMMVITAQGGFTDARVRPVRLEAGVARLAELAPDARFLPLAIEYVHWTERGPEALCAFGRPIDGADLAGLPRPERLGRLERGLEAAMDRLARDAIARDPGRFVSLLEGRAGVGGIYDLWRRAKAAIRGERFDPAHGGRDPAPR